eukprot:scaffold2737_cov99-Cylindrotheca_fusiformis.AAC.5
MMTLSPLLSPSARKPRLLSMPSGLADGESSSSSAAGSSQQSQRRKEEICLQILRRFCEMSDIQLSDHTIFRYACLHHFNAQKAKSAIRNCHDRHYLDLRMRGELEEQFYSCALFPLPAGLKTKKGNSSVFYMRPSRYDPTKTPTKKIIENLCYVLNDRSNTRQRARDGVAFVANMKGWTMHNFSMDYCRQFMYALQGHIVPTRVVLFLIVNPPSWFGNVWKLMRPMLSKSFSRKVHIVKQEKLADYLMKGYDKYLPDELAAAGKNTDELAAAGKNTSEIVEDYVDLKGYEDEEETGFEL